MKKIFLLGDIINLHYAPYLEEYLKNNFEIQTKPGREDALQQINSAVGANGGDSAQVLEYVKQKEADNDLNFDIFLFNCGLHDIKRKVPEEKLQISIEEYEKNLNEIYKIMETHGIKCVFITTTPVYEEAHNEQLPGGIKRYNKDVCEYNKAAVKVAMKHNVPLIDLYGFITKVSGETHLDYAHFNFMARKLQAAFIAGSMISLL